MGVHRLGSVRLVSILVGSTLNLWGRSDSLRGGRALAGWVGVSLVALMGWRAGRAAEHLIH